MRRFYFIFMAVAVLFFTLIYLPVWWFIGGMGIGLAIIAYNLYDVRLKALNDRNLSLEDEIVKLNEQVEHFAKKEERTSNEAEAVKKTKQDLLRILNHEIRTPMNGIMGMTVLLADTSLTQMQKEYTETIRSCGESLLSTVNDILVKDIVEFSKVDSSRRKIEDINFDLRDSIEEVLDLFATRAAKRRLDLVYHIESNVPLQVTGDGKRLRQILMNLIDNAVKYTDKGEIYVDVSIKKPSPMSLPEFSFEVRDSGKGIAREQLKYLFLGVQHKGERSDNESSRGLGLVVCRKLTEIMGGQIGVDSELGKGTSFYFTVPLVPNSKLLNANEIESEFRVLKGKKVLVVDDNPLSLTTLGKKLDAMNISATLVNSAEKALQQLNAAEQYDLVIIDKLMEGSDGITLAKNIGTGKKSLPLILLAPEGEKFSEGSELFTAVISKPVRQHILRDKLKEILCAGKTLNVKTASTLTDDFSSQHPLRILIAEDNLVNQKIATKLLTKLGYQPGIASNGKEALEMVSNDQYDLILMDVQMPEMDGMEATRMIRTCLQTQPVIIAMTANVMQGDRDSCIQSGMDDYMSKPIEVPELLRQLEKWATVIKSRKAA